MTDFRRLWKGAGLLMWVLLLSGAAGEYRARPAAAQSSGGETFLLNADDAAGLSGLQASGAVRLADYGGFTLWELPEGAAPPAGLRAVPNEVELRGLRVDGPAGQPETLLPPELRAAAVPEDSKRLWLAQFAGPVRDAWLEDLRAAGQQVVGCMGGNTCLLWGVELPAARTAWLRGDVADGLTRWVEEFHPAYRLAPELRPGGSARAAAGELEVTLQLLDVSEAQAALTELEGLALRVDPARRVLNLLNVRARVRAADLDRLAALAPLVNLEPYRAPVLLDELQGQILWGSVNPDGSAAPAAAGYLAALSAAGLPTDPAAYPILDIVDDGIDQGDAAAVLHPDFYLLGSLSNPDRIAYLESCLADGSANGVGGHGNLNAGIAGGYNDRGGFPYTDAAGALSGFRYGLGISPFGRLAGTKAFTNGGGWDVSRCGGSYSGLVARLYANGARLSNNSWGDPAAYGEYDSDAQEYDALTRDADPDAPGNQEMLHIFSAGNNYTAGSLGSPGTAKNVLTVGATDFPRTGGTAEDLAAFSSRGPTDDGRAKPDLVAPGNEIEGPASQDPAYTGSSLSIRGYFPLNQTLYTYSSGTSHSAPAVAGAAQLVYADYAAAHGGSAPSPALLKALLINSARYLNGYRAGGSLPSFNQGWGMPDLGRAFSTPQPLLLDQSIVFDESGESRSWNFALDAPAEAVRVTLVWTDAPGLTSGPALVNDLDLEVTLDGTLYRGNVFSGAYSSAGGSADGLNNVESVFLPPARAEQLEVRVTAAVVAGDGVPGQGDASDQDFALVVSVQPGYVYYYPWIEKN